MASDEALRVLGGHDLNFSCESWTLFLDEMHEQEGMSPERRLLLKGRFSKWGVWPGEVTVRLLSLRFMPEDHDEKGRPITGLVSWNSGFDSAGKDIEGF